MPKISVRTRNLMKFGNYFGALLILVATGLKIFYYVGIKNLLTEPDELILDIYTMYSRLVKYILQI